MKFVGFAATYSPETNEITNKHNYFLNGLIKDSIGDSACTDVCDISGFRNLYALADGSKSVGRGENAAYLCMDLMSSIFGADFHAEQKNYFDSASDIVKGRSFQENGLDMAVDMSVLYLCGNWARVYNVGSVSVFHHSNRLLTKISGEMPELIQVEEVIEEDGALKIEKKFKKTVPYIGYLSGDFELAPYVSEKVRVKDSDAFVIATESVMAIVSEDDILTVLNDPDISNSKKASAIIDLAVEKDPEGNYTVEIIKSKVPKRIIGIRLRLIALAVAAILTITGIFVFPYIQNAGNSAKQSFAEFLLHLMYGDRNDEEVIWEPWVPIDEEDDEKEPEKNEGSNEVEESTQNVQKPATTPTTPTTPATKPSVKPNTNSSTEETETPVKVEPPAAPPPLENSDVELPIDFD
ncbi:MAG: hypothetical protein IKW62_01110 [Clostridia bacterium]|nr:hypothetical protein [Clostridia bacterium]